MSTSVTPSRALPETPPADAPRDAVVASGLELSGSRGRVFGPLDLTVPEGWLLALTGAEGSGRTSLLLCLAGHMKPSRGQLTVLGEHLPRGRRRVLAHTALAGFDGIDVVDEGLRVSELLIERLNLVTPLWRGRPDLTSAPVQDTLDVCFGDDRPPLDAFVWQLSPAQHFRFRLALALVGKPRLLVVDDLTQLRDPADQSAVWRTLQRICGHGITVVAATANPAAIPADVATIDLPAHPENTETRA